MSCTDILFHDVYFHPQLFLQRLEPYPYLKGKMLQLPWAITILNPTVLQRGYYDVVHEGECFHLFFRGVSAKPTDFTDGKYMSSLGHGWFSLGEGKDLGNHHGQVDADPMISPGLNCENALGCEDPIIIELLLDEADKKALKDEAGINPELGYLYLAYYVAVGGLGENKREIGIALAISQDPHFKVWHKLGLVMPTSVVNKSGMVLPKGPDGKWRMLLTVKTETPDSAILMIPFNSLKELLHPDPKTMEKILNNYADHLFLGPSSHGVHKGPEIGAGVVALADSRMILVFCPENRKPGDAWDVSALLLDRDGSILAYVDLPIQDGLRPEDKGLICNNCTFPRGALLMERNGQLMLLIAIGTGDDGLGWVCCPLNHLMAAFELDARMSAFICSTHSHGPSN